MLKFLKYFAHFWNVGHKWCFKSCARWNLKCTKEKVKGFLSNLIKTINRAEMTIENEKNISEIAWLQLPEFSIFKLHKNVEGICLHASGTEMTKTQQLFNENNERANSVIIWCDERFIIQLNDDKETYITTYAFD